MFISTIFGDLGDLPVMVRRPKGALKIFLEHSLGIICISSISLLFGCSFDLFQLIETVLLKSTNFEFIGNCLHRVLQFKRNGYHLIDIRIQIKATFTIFKSISASRNSFYISQPKC